jgi:phage-related minor tail protein
MEAGMLEEKMKILSQEIAKEKNPVVLEKLKKQFEDLRSEASQFEAWLIGMSQKKFGDSLVDMETQLLSLEALLTSTNDPVQIKKWTQAIKQLRGQIGEIEEGPLYAFKQQLEDVTAAAQLVPEKLALIDEKLKNTDLTKSQREALLKLRDEVQGLDSDFIKLGQSITDAVAGNATNSVNQFIDSIGQAKFSFADFTTSVLKDIAKIIFQLLIMQPIVESIKRSLTGFGGGGPELLNSFFTPGSKSANLDQDVYSSPQVFKFADGGVFGSRIGVMGEAGPEAIMPLKRNSSGRLGVEAAPTNITIINNAGADVQATETTNSDGTKQIDIYVERKVKEMFGGGAMDKSMKASYGLTRVGV